MLGKGAQAKGDDWSLRGLSSNNLGGVHKVWTGVSAQEMGDNYCQTTPEQNHSR